MNNKEEELVFLKRLWSEKETICPKCNSGILEFLHKKAKKNACDWKCPVCGEIYRTMNMFKEFLNE